MELLQREIEILKRVDHPNIIKFYGTYEDKNYFHIIMEYCEGGELFERIIKKGFSEKQAAHSFKNMMSAIIYLHIKGISHRDLKPENYLYSTKL